MYDAKLGRDICPECKEPCQIITIRVREPGKTWDYRGSNCCEAPIEE